MPKDQITSWDPGIIINFENSDDTARCIEVIRAMIDAGEAKMRELKITGWLHWSLDRIED